MKKITVLKSIIKRAGAMLAVAMVLAMSLGMTVSAEEKDNDGTAIEATVTTDSTVGTKAIAAAFVVGIAAATGAIGMGMAISKSAEGIARQPEAEGKIRTTLMLGLVFIETATIYALIVVILIIFVM